MVIYQKERIVDFYRNIPWMCFTACDFVAAPRIPESPKSNAVAQSRRLFTVHIPKSISFTCCEPGRKPNTRLNRLNRSPFGDGLRSSRVPEIGHTRLVNFSIKPCEDILLKHTPYHPYTDRSSPQILKPSINPGGYSHIFRQQFNWSGPLVHQPILRNAAWCFCQKNVLKGQVTMCHPQIMEPPPISCGRLSRGFSQLPGKW